MSKGAIQVVAILRAQPGMEQQLRDVLLGLVEPTRAEPGCVSYDLHINKDNPAEFVFVESWTNAASLDAHFETSHIKSVIGRFPDLVVSHSLLLTLDSAVHVGDVCLQTMNTDSRPSSRRRLWLTCLQWE